MKFCSDPYIAAITPDGELAYATYYSATLDETVLAPDGRLYSTALPLHGGRITHLLSVNAGARPNEPFAVGCLVDAARFVSTAISPGAILTLFGDGIGPAAGVLATVEGNRIPFADRGHHVDGRRPAGPHALCSRRPGELHRAVGHAFGWQRNTGMRYAGAENEMSLCHHLAACPQSIHEWT